MRKAQDRLGRSGLRQCRHDQIELGFAGIVDADCADRVRGRQFFRIAACKAQIGSCRIDIRPEFVGGGDVAIDTMTLRCLEGEQVCARLQKSSRDVEADIGLVVGRADLLLVHHAIVEENRELRCFGSDDDRVLIGKVELRRRGCLLRCQIDGPGLAVGFALKPQFCKGNDITAQSGRGRLRLLCRLCGLLGRGSGHAGWGDCLRRHGRRFRRQRRCRLGNDRLRRRLRCDDLRHDGRLAFRPFARHVERRRLRLRGSGGKEKNQSWKDAVHQLLAFASCRCCARSEPTPLKR